MQNIDYKTQLKIKQNTLRNLFRKAGINGLPEIRIVESEPYGYRERVQFHKIMPQSRERTPRYGVLRAQARKDGGRQYGFKARKSNEIIPVEDCPVASPVIRRALKNAELKIPPDKDRWNVYGRGELLLSEAENKRGVIRLLGKELAADASCFFQSNGSLLEKLITELLEIAAGAAEKMRAGERVGDFYCGCGTFAVFLSCIFREMDLLEADRASLNLAKENLRRQVVQSETAQIETANGENHPTGVRFFPMTDTQWARKKMNTRYGFLVADPARSGLPVPVREALNKNKPSVFCYVSCNPASLARDTKSLLEGGFELRRLTLYDFYPQTEQIETLAVFTPAPGD